MAQKTFKYKKDNVTVIWQPELCVHSGICVKGLPGVFNAQRKPWIDMEQGTAEAIVAQVRKCPSGALSYVMNDEQPENAIKSEAAAITNIEITPDGPILIKNECHITYSDGHSETKTGTIALCRCGQSAKKPYCDGAHRRTGFTG